MERNLEDKAGVSPRFRFERNDDGTPMFEDFAKKNHRLQHGGKTFYLFGTCDGIMEYYTEDGEKLRVGLEVKTKQSTPARTSFYSMREPDAKHVKQCVCYAEMYDVDYYVILYVNTAHKGWFMSDEDYEKTPDIRAFGIHITQTDKDMIFDRFVDILGHVERNEEPRLDLDNFTFNNYKTVIAKEMPREEFADLQEYARRVEHSDLPGFKKANVRRAVETLTELREVAD